MTTTPPGWYDDGHGALRWWDGAQWTEHVAQPDPEPSDAPTEAEIVASQQTLGDAYAETTGQFVHAGQPVHPAQPSSGEQPAYPAAQPEYGVQPGHGAQPMYPEQLGYQAAPAHAASYPPGAYPQAAYPGADAAGGAFTAATEPRKSRLWIVWVVLGIVLLGIVIAAAVLIPLMFLSLSSSNAAAHSDDEKAAVAAVQLYDHAWQSADCEELGSATSDDFRTEYALEDCSEFESQADWFDESFDDYEVRITAVSTDGDEITVQTRETYKMLVDENGDPTDATAGYTDYSYTIVEDDGAWVIDDVQ